MWLKKPGETMQCTERRKTHLGCHGQFLTIPNLIIAGGLSIRFAPTIRNRRQKCIRRTSCFIYVNRRNLGATDFYPEVTYVGGLPSHIFRTPCAFHAKRVEAARPSRPSVVVRRVECEGMTGQVDVLPCPKQLAL